MWLNVSINVIIINVVSEISLEFCGQIDVVSDKEIKMDA